MIANWLFELIQNTSSAMTMPTSFARKLMSLASALTSLVGKLARLVAMLTRLVRNRRVEKSFNH